LRSTAHGGNAGGVLFCSCFTCLSHTTVDNYIHMPKNNGTINLPNFKIIKSGSIVECYRYRGRFFMPSGHADASADYSAYRSRDTLRRTISSNWGQWHDDKSHRYFMPLFMTFTFRENLTDIVEANRRFHGFILRLNRELLGSEKSVLKYSYVIEVQERGSFHFHMVVYNLPYINSLIQKLSSIWNAQEKNGSAHYKSNMKDVRNVGSYVTKYMSKDFTRADIPKGYHLYNNANHLIKPEVIVSSFGAIDNTEILDYLGNLEKQKLLFEKMGDTIIYSQYHVPSGFFLQGS
jgi:hypothetical protein